MTLRVVIAKPRKGVGGGSTMALRIAGGLRERGHQVSFLCHPGSRFLDHARAAGFPAIPVLAGKDFTLASNVRVIAALRRDPPDVLLNLMAGPGDVLLSLPAACALRVPVVVRRGISGPTRATPRERRLLLGAAAFIAASTPIAKALQLDLGLERSPKVIHNAVDPAAFEALDPAPVGAGDGPVVGFVGRLHRDKGILDLAAAWPRVRESAPTARLVLVGDGPHEAELRDALAGAGGVSFLGYRRDVAQVMAALDVLVLPSHTEGFGMVLLEAMAAGTPVVATRVDGPLEVVAEEETGILVPPGDVVALAAAVARLAADPDLRARMGAAGAERVRRRFSAPAMVDRYEAVLRSAAERSAPGPRRAPPWPLAVARLAACWRGPRG